MIFDAHKKHEVSLEFSKNAYLNKTLHQQLLQKSNTDRISFWAELARENLCFQQDFHTTLTWNPPFARWFEGGKINASEQILESALNKGLGDKTALIWEGEPVEESGQPTERRAFTYSELHAQVCAFSEVLRTQGLRAGDRAILYMPLVPETVVVMLACARLGVTHSVVFAGFSAESLRDRANDAQAQCLFTFDFGFRRGKKVELLENVRKVSADIPSLQHVFVFQRIQANSYRPLAKEKCFQTLLSEQAQKSARSTIPEPEGFDSEHPLFILYTSGTTGKPKGVVHSTAGYLLWAKMTMQWVFDIKPTDVFWCTADVGWITGHTYLVYGPLSAGATVFLYEGSPDFPDFGRFWRSIERERVTIFYTAPTAIRAFMRQGDSFPQGSDLTSLRLLGSVGEPINPEAWEWYFRVIGDNLCPIVDTWWQTETGGIMMCALPGVHAAKPGCATAALPGLEIDVVDDSGLPVEAGKSGKLVIKSAWPSQLRTVYGDPQRYQTNYWSTFSGPGGSERDPWYFTGDGAYRDADGDVWITGRVDDVLNVAGHRIGTMELESALVEHSAVAEAAVVGAPHELKGTSIFAFVTLKKSYKDLLENPEKQHLLQQQLRQCVEKEIGKFALPDHIRFTDALPKTRSGKIMRRLLRDIASQKETLGDTSTLEDVSVLSSLAHYQEE
jgi:acetyl-CoA synthetase